MKDLSSSPEVGASAGAHPNPPQAKEAGVRNPAAKRAPRAVYATLGVLTALLLAQWWWSHTQISGLREEVAQRLKSSDTLNTETKVMVKSVQEGMKELQGKVSVLEGKQVEAQSQQLALEQLYQDLSKNRDDWALAEIEQVLSTASQQLQLAGNVQGALIALQNADSRLSRSDKPQFLTIRRALAKDMERLRALPNVDLTGMALRLDSVIGQIDAMPLLSDEKPAPLVTPPKNARRPKNAEGTDKSASAAGNANADWLATLQDRWTSWSNEMWAELRQLIRIRNVETPEALLLSPTQAYYIRENLKLRLLNARQALLAHNESAFRSDLIAAQEAISKYFDPRARQTQSVQTLLRQVQATDLSIEMPTLAESLNAVRNYKAKP